MDARTSVQLLLDELGSQLGIERPGLDEDDIVTMRFDGRMVCVATDASSHGLILFAPLGDPRQTPGLIERALLSNFLWRATDGATLAIEPQTGELPLQRHLPLAGLDYPGFVTALESFLDQADRWAGEIAAQAAVAGQSPPAAVVFDPSMLA